MSLLGRVVKRLGVGQELVPGGRRLQPLLLEEILPVHEELHVGVHRHRVLCALERARGDGRRNEILKVQGLHSLVERKEKFRERGNPGLVHEDDVVPAGASAERQKLLLVQITERRGVDDDLDARFLLEVGEARAQHVFLVAGEHRERDRLALRRRRHVGARRHREHDQQRPDQILEAPRDPH